MDDGHLVLAVRPGAHDNRVHIDRAVNMFAAEAGFLLWVLS